MIKHIVNQHITPVSTGEGNDSSDDQMEEDTTQQVS